MTSVVKVDGETGRPTRYKRERCLNCSASLLTVKPKYHGGGLWEYRCKVCNAGNLFRTDYDGHEFAYLRSQLSWNKKLWSLMILFLYIPTVVFDKIFGLKHTAVYRFVQLLEMIT